MNKNKFYITNAIPYVNAKPHVGHALEFVQSDVTKRFHKLLGKTVLLLCGGDENAIKNVQAAEVAGIPIQDFVDTNSKLFQSLAEKLNVNFDIFQKGSGTDHHLSSQELWKLCEKNGDIYKKNYTGYYCIGCELFYEKAELNKKGECFEHPGKPLETVNEENYFFKLSRYQNDIIKLLESDQLIIIPKTRKNEMLSFANQGLQDISISRSNKRAKNWGVPVPGDDTQRMYVWFDALNIYRSGLGDKYYDFWPADVHVIGKGITRFHAIYWPAFLMSAGLPLPRSLFVHGYFTVDGQKMSKTLGNVVDPIELINKYGTDALRYYFLSQIPSSSDGDFSEEKLKHIYNADLANGLGNLVSRVAKLCETVNLKSEETPTLEQSTNRTEKVEGTIETGSKYQKLFEKFAFSIILNEIWLEIASIDQKINEEAPWKLVGNDEEKLIEVLSKYVLDIKHIAILLQPFLPNTSEKILKQFSWEIKSSDLLFPRINKIHQA